MRLTPLLLLPATLAFAAAPLFTPPFQGYDPALFPVVIPHPAIQPAGFAFAIWGLIYCWLIVHAGYGLWRRSGDAAWQPSRLPLLGATLLGTVWLAIAPGYPITATVTILVMALLAVSAFLNAPTTPDRWLLSAPMAIFAGWLTAAAAVSTGVLLAGYGWLTNENTALILMLLVFTVAVSVQTRKPAMPVYGATVTWALIGVFAANWSNDMPNVAIPALIGAVMMVTATMVLNTRR